MNKSPSGLDYFRFVKWPVYADAKKFARMSIESVRHLPREYRYELGSQIIRSSTSVALNIAEGSGKYSDKDFKHYLSIALGSLFETIASFDILRDSRLVTEERFLEIKRLGNIIASQIGGMKKKLAQIS